MKTGNVILSPYGNMEIVVKITGDEKKELVHVVSFDFENSSGIHNIKDSQRLETCGCVYYSDDQAIADCDCKSCKGSGNVKIKIHGWGRSQILASNAKEYIKKSLLKNFEGLKF